jgi:Protein of unknown function (DUF1566).
VSQDGLTVTDTITGLVWQRDGSSARKGCTGRMGDLTCNWAGANAYCAFLTLGGISGWRMPTVTELQTIVDFRVPPPGPTIDHATFPNTPSELFWTASPNGGQAGKEHGIAWGVAFSTGSLDRIGLVNFRVRCVRYAGAAPCHSKHRFVVLDDRLVLDTLTELVWQRQASGRKLNWRAARRYCSSAGAGFRLPTVKELRSIVSFSISPPGPTIDRWAAFPNTPSELFWTSSPYAGSPSRAWSVDFSSGYSGSLDVGGTNRVRCVR